MNPVDGLSEKQISYTLDRNLGANKRLYIVLLDGQEYIDIRQWIPNLQDDGYAASSRGVSIPLNRYVAFSDIIPDATKRLYLMVKKQEVNHFQHIGGNLHVNEMK